MRLKILSWNIWYDGQFDKISRFLTSGEADIICLQEMTPDDPTRDTIGLLKKLGYKYAYAPAHTIENDGRTMSNAIFSKYHIIRHETYVLSDTDRRNALRADIKIGETILHVFCTHLLHTHQRPSAAQELQAKNLMKVLSNERTVAMGDFNATPESAAIKEMAKIMADSDPSLTATLYAPLFNCSGCDSRTIAGTRLDYIFTSRDIKVNSFKVHGAAGSDHLPISVIIEI